MNLESARGGRPHWALLAGPITVVTALGIVGTVLTAPLAVHHPLLLLVLEARDRNLLLARHVALVPYLVVGAIRRLCTDPLFYLLGRFYGPDAVAWLQSHGGGRIVSLTERAFRRAVYPMLVIFPGAIVCTLAGEVGVPPLLFGGIVIVRTVAALLLIRWVGNVFAGPIDALLAFFDHNLAVVTIVSAVATVAWVVMERRRSVASREEDDAESPGASDL